MKPSNFTSVPMGSVLQEYDHELMACNIMIILERTGNVFRDLSWDEYKKERLKDGRFDENSEKYCFDRVIDYCKSPDTAKLLGGTWSKLND